MKNRLLFAIALSLLIAGLMISCSEPSAPPEDDRAKTVTPAADPEEAAGTTGEETLAANQDASEDDAVVNEDTVGADAVSVETGAVPAGADGVVTGSESPDGSADRGEEGNDAGSFSGGVDSSSVPLSMRPPIDTCIGADYGSVVLAVYTGRYEPNPNGLTLTLHFNAVKWYRGPEDAGDAASGARNESSFEATIYPSDMHSNDPRFIPYEAGKSYLLILGRQFDVYYPGQDYIHITRGSLVIPADNVEASTIYGLPLTDYLKGMDSLEGVSVDGLGAYLASCYAGNELYAGTDYCRSDEISAITNYADTVFVGTVSKISMKTENWRSDLWEVTVDVPMKGKVKADQTVNVEIAEDAVKEGDTFIFTLVGYDTTGLGWYKYAAKNSLYATERLDEFRALLP